MQFNGDIRCPLCLAIYDEPKSLSCSHTFCKSCLGHLLNTTEDKDKAPCPVCEEITYVLGGNVGEVPTDIGLRKKVEDARKMSHICTCCNPAVQSTAVSYCHECADLMCKACQKSHSEWQKFSGHTVIGMSDIVSGSVMSLRRKCAKHPAEDKELFCMNCERYVCFKCGVMEHERKDRHNLIDGAEHEGKTQEEGKCLLTSAEDKKSTVSKYVDFIHAQRQNLKLINTRLADDIEKAYEESVKRLSERRDALRNEITSSTEKVDKELSTMEECGKQEIARVDVIGKLLNKGLKMPLEEEALKAHKFLRRRMEDIIQMVDPDFRHVEGMMADGERLLFRRKIEETDVEIGEIVVTKEPWHLHKEVELLSKNSMSDVTMTPKGNLAVACNPGGIEVYTAMGDRLLFETNVGVKNVFALAFLSDSRLVIRHISNNISLYTPDGEKLDVRFKTLREADGDLGGIAVDIRDRIFVTYRKAKLIQIFNSSGGKEVGRIVCTNFAPVRAFPLNAHRRILVKSGNSAVRVIDDNGNLVRNLSKGDAYHAHPALYGNDDIIVAWVNYLEGRVSIDHYTSDLKHIKALITETEVHKYKRKWYSLQAFETGKIAFCTTSKVYIFQRNYP